MVHELPALPYATNALEPHIDTRTMEIHHGKHHQAYVTNLNNALDGHSALQAIPLEDLLRNLSDVPESIRTVVRNNGGGHHNHSLFWVSLSPVGGGSPNGALGDAVTAAFGSFDSFKEQFSKAAMGRFGSGWAWLAMDAGGKLVISSTPNQDSPLMDGMVPLLGLDVWEHAYYLLYQNRRADYVAAWWNVVNWPVVAERFAASRK